MTPSADIEDGRATNTRAALTVNVDTEPDKTLGGVATKVATTHDLGKQLTTERRIVNAGILTTAYIGASTLLVVGLSGLLKPTTARRGMARGMVGAAILIVVVATGRTLATTAISG